MLTIDDDISNKDNEYLEKPAVKKLTGSVKKYFQKWSGQHQPSEPSVQFFECIIIFLGTFFGLGIIPAVHYRILAKYRYH